MRNLIKLHENDRILFFKKLYGETERNTIFHLENQEAKILNLVAILKT